VLNPSICQFQHARILRCVRIENAVSRSRTHRVGGSRESRGPRMVREEHRAFSRSSRFSSTDGILRCGCLKFFAWSRTRIYRPARNAVRRAARERMAHASCTRGTLSPFFFVSEGRWIGRYIRGNSRRESSYVGPTSPGGSKRHIAIMTLCVHDGSATGLSRRRACCRPWHRATVAPSCHIGSGLSIRLTWG